MRIRHYIILAAALGLLHAMPTFATSYHPFPMEDMFSEADAVVFAKIIRGTMEGFETPIYEAEVVESIKGMPSGARFVFGRYSGTELGGEYLLFLSKSNDLLVEALTAEQSRFISRRPEVVYEVMFVGYGSMLVDYTCRPFEKCLHCVDVPVEMVPIPEEVERVPYDDPRSRVSDHAWVKKDVLLEYLRSLAQPGRDVVQSPPN